MKARIRTIKPEAFTDEVLWDLEQDTGLPIFRAFSGLWCHADREGRFEWRARPLKAGILPYWDGDFSRVLDALSTRGLVVKYTVDGRAYGYIPGFKKHQAINAREDRSRLPPPVHSSNDSETFDACSTRAARDEDASSTLHDPARVEQNRTEQKGTEHASGHERVEESREPEEPHTLPASLTKASKIPIALRCKLALERKDLADYARASEWPEILEASAILAPAMSINAPRFAAFSKDSNVRALAEILAAGFSLDEIRRAALKIPSHPWLSDKRKFSTITVPMMNELLAEVAPPRLALVQNDGPAPADPAIAERNRVAMAAIAKQRLALLDEVAS